MGPQNEREIKDPVCFTLSDLFQTFSISSNNAHSDCSGLSFLVFSFPPPMTIKGFFACDIFFLSCKPERKLLYNKI